MSSIAQPVARSVSRSVLAGQRMNLGYLIRSMFSNNEVGFAYDPNDLTTLYQDAAGTIPVTGAGQHVGLVLDKSRGLVLGPELWNDSLATLTGESQRLSPGVYRIYSSSGAASGVTLPSQTPNKFRVVEFTVDSVTNAGGGICVESSTGQLAIYTPGRYRVIASSTYPNVFIKRLGVCDFTISNVSVKELPGNHAYQTTPSMRPLLQNSPRKIDYDGVDDKLTASLPAQLTGCTVIRAVPSVGAQILTNQTITTPYNDSTDHCGLIVINRALTQTETAQITQIFNRLAGV